MHVGFIFLTGGIVYSAVKNFAKTYNDNEVLLAETQELNETLEHKVQERTAELAEEKIPSQSSPQYESSCIFC